MKMRITALVVILLVAVGFVACGGGGSSDPASSNNTSSTCADSWVCLSDGVYQVYGSNTFSYPSSQPADWFSLLKHSDWTFIGQSNSTHSFVVNNAFSWILITWSGTPAFYFDAIVDETSGSSWKANVGNHWLTYMMSNYLSNTADNYPSNFEGNPDLIYSTGNVRGYSAMEFHNTISSSTGTGSIKVYATTTP